jgi:hypothetical protein
LWGVLLGVTELWNTWLGITLLGITLLWRIGIRIARL